jgi:hypothetical protein
VWQTAAVGLWYRSRLYIALIERVNTLVEIIRPIKCRRITSKDIYSDATYGKVVYEVSEDHNCKSVFFLAKTARKWC